MIPNRNALQLVILDRDGVINADSDNYIRSVEEFVPLPGSLNAILRLREAGLLVAIATNQSGIARGYFDEATLAAMHAKLRQLLTAEAQQAGVSNFNADECFAMIAFCPHGPDDESTCRKPLPGMLLQILDHTGVPPEAAIMVGDSARDIAAGQAAGVPGVLVRSGKGERTLQQATGDPAVQATLAGVPVFADLAAVVAEVLSIAVDLD